MPTLHHVLFPEERPARWRIDPDDFDHERIGQKVREMPPAPAVDDRGDRRRIFDTQREGKGNGGHEAMLAPLSAADRRAILEYLKTL